MFAKKTEISQTRKIVNDGVFFAEVNEFFARELAEEGYWLEIKKSKIEIVIRAVRTRCLR